MGHDGVGQAALAQPAQIGNRGLAARDHDDIHISQVGRLADPTDHHPGLAGQRLDIGGIRDPR